MSIVRWFTWPFFRLQQNTYFEAIVFKRKQAHNAKYVAMKAAWERNSTFDICRRLADGLSKIDMRSDPGRALSAIEELLESMFFNSTAELLEAFESEVERMIEFENNAVLQMIEQAYPHAPTSLTKLSKRPTRSTELEFENAAKKQLGLMANELEQMVAAYDALINTLPDLRKGCKPTWFTRAIGIGGWLTGQAGNLASSRSDNLFAAVAIEVGGQVLKGLIQDLHNSISTQRLDEAVEVFEKIANWFQGACLKFSASSAQRFDPIMRAFMVYEKEYEDEFLRALNETARSDCSLKPVYEKIYGKLGY